MWFLFGNNLIAIEQSYKRKKVGYAYPYTWELLNMMQIEYIMRVCVRVALQVHVHVYSA